MLLVGIAFKRVLLTGGNLFESCSMMNHDSCDSRHRPIQAVESPHIADEVHVKCWYIVDSGLSHLWLLFQFRRGEESQTMREAGILRGPHDVKNFFRMIPFHRYHATDPATNPPWFSLGTAAGDDDIANLSGALLVLVWVLGIAA